MSSFIPSLKDEEWLSLFEITEPNGEELVAAALTFNKGAAPVAQYFLVVDREDLERVGLTIRKSDGKTFHPSVNDRHYEVNLPDLLSVTTALEVFMEGDYRPVEKATVWAALGQSASNDNIDFALVMSRLNGNVSQRSMELVKDKYLAISPLQS